MPVQNWAIEVIRATNPDADVRSLRGASIDHTLEALANESYIAGQKAGAPKGYVLVPEADWNERQTARNNEQRAATQQRAEPGTQNARPAARGPQPGTVEYAETASPQELLARRNARMRGG